MYELDLIIGLFVHLPYIHNILPMKVKLLLLVLNLGIHPWFDLSTDMSTNLMNVGISVSLNNVVVPFHHGHWRENVTQVSLEWHVCVELYGQLQGQKCRHHKQPKDPGKRVLSLYHRELQVVQSNWMSPGTDFPLPAHFLYAGKNYCTLFSINQYNFHCLMGMINIVSIFRNRKLYNICIYLKWEGSVE